MYSRRRSRNPVGDDRNPVGDDQHVDARGVFVDHVVTSRCLCFSAHQRLVAELALTAASRPRSTGVIEVQ